MVVLVPRQLVLRLKGPAVVVAEEAVEAAVVAKVLDVEYSVPSGLFVLVVQHLVVEREFNGVRCCCITLRPFNTASRLCIAACTCGKQRPSVCSSRPARSI